MLAEDELSNKSDEISDLDNQHLSFELYYTTKSYTP